MLEKMPYFWEDGWDDASRKPGISTCLFMRLMYDRLTIIDYISLKLHANNIDGNNYYVNYVDLYSAVFS